MEEKVIYKEECFAIQGAVFEVYREMGCGFLEAVYQECLEKEFKHRNIPFKPQTELTLLYKGEILTQRYKPDLIWYDKIILELKAVKNLSPEHDSQVINYLKATNMRLGLLINFGHLPKVEIKRFGIMINDLSSRSYPVKRVHFNLSSISCFSWLTSVRIREKGAIFRSMLLCLKQ